MLYFSISVHGDWERAMAKGEEREKDGWEEDRDERVSLIYLFIIIILLLVRIVKELFE